MLNADIARSLESNTSHDLDGSVSYYFESLASILNKHAPEKTREFIIREKVPWMNEDILREKRKRKKLELQWRSSELAVHKEMFIHQKSIVKSMCDKAKTTYYRDKVDNCEQATLFKLAESLLHGKEKKSLPDHKKSFHPGRRIQSVFHHENCQHPFETGISSSYATSNKLFISN